RRVPFVRDGVFDHGRASAPRIAAPHILPSAELTASASAILMLSRLNSPPHTIVVYASWPPSPTSHATLTTRRALPLTWAGLPPAGTRQLPGAPVRHSLGPRSGARPWQAEGESPDRSAVRDRDPFAA